MTKFHPFACGDVLGVVQLEYIPLQSTLKIRAREMAYEPLYPSVFDHIRELARLSGKTYEQVVAEARNG